VKEPDHSGQIEQQPDALHPDDQLVLLAERVDLDEQQNNHWKDRHYRPE
jgi:hypothetical protein